MGGWTAANVDRPKRRREDVGGEDEDAGYDGDADDQNRSTADCAKRRRRSAETIEAGLARLSSSYNAAMGSVGTLHRISMNMVRESAGSARGSSHGSDACRAVKDDAGSTSRLDQLCGVANAARDALASIIQDPLVRPYVPTWLEIAEDSVRYGGLSRGAEEERQISSANHRSTVKELTYLVLVNYGDLLMCGCGYQSFPSAIQSKLTLLDRGTVRILEGLQMTRQYSSRALSHGCWEGESDEDTKRLALTAYCDASELDGSDPTLWLKIACAARALGRVIFNRRTKSAQNTEESEGEDATFNNYPSPTLFNYRRLERYALDRGKSCLPAGVPPNRAISRALKEWQGESHVERVERYPSALLREPQPQTLVIDLPRYSWSVAGRMLMRAYREGGSNQSNSFHGLDRCEPCSSIDVRISCMLTIPASILGAICEYLDDKGALSRDILSLECTCRALSSDIVTARAATERIKHQRMSAAEQIITKHAQDNDVGDDACHSNSSKACDSGGAPSEHKSNDEKKGSKAASAGAKTSTRSNRISKRVLSQRITSGKQAERTFKRKSVEYCLVSAFFSCTVQHPVYVACLLEEAWPNVRNGQNLKQKLRTTRSSGEIILPSPLAMHLARSRSDAKTGARYFTFGDESSLRSFITVCGKNKSGASEILRRFLCHVSRHVRSVYASDTGGSTALSSCILECYDLVTTRCGYRKSLAPCWYGAEIFVASAPLWEKVDVLAVNLLNAELRLRRCERQGFDFVDFEDDAVSLSYTVPHLLKLADDLEANCSVTERNTLQILCIRCNWLAACFKLWLSRWASQLNDIRSAETSAIGHIENTLSRFSDTSCGPLILPTPHLESPSRTGRHWRELSADSLASYMNELKASFVVSRARQMYQELKLHERRERPIQFTEVEEEVLASVATELIERYGISYEGLGGKHDELLDDWLKFHGTDLSAGDRSSEGKHPERNHKNTNVASEWEAIWNLVPLLPAQIDSVLTYRELSLTTILVVSCQRKANGFEEICALLSGLTLAALDRYRRSMAQALDQSDQQKATPGRKGGESSDSFLSDSDDGLAPQSLGPVDQAQRDKALTLARFFLEKLAELVSICPSGCFIADYATGTDFVSLLEKAFLVSGGEQGDNVTQLQLLKCFPRLELFEAVSRLVSTLFDKLLKDRAATKHLKSTAFAGLVGLLVKMRRIFPALLRSKGEQRISRSERQEGCVQYATFVSALASDIARFLSVDQSVVCGNGLLEESTLISSLACCNDDEGKDTSAPSVDAIVQFIDSLIWFWKYIEKAEILGFEVAPSRPSVFSANSLDRANAGILAVPIASSIISLCGGIGHGCDRLGKRTSFLKFLSNTNTSGDDKLVASMSDFCDTDDSANHWFSDKDQNEDDESQRLGSSRNLLKMLLQSVQCCGLVFSGMEESLVCSLVPTRSMQSSCDVGPLLPVVVVRTLTHIADVLLNIYGTDDVDKRGGVWAEEFPYSVRKTGLQLDSMLHKAYRCLHGFTLTSQNIQNELRDLPLPNIAMGGQIPSSKFYPPESTKAAIRLYRCIRRAYPCKGRRSPPKQSLECVASILPAARETERSRSIREFMFTGSAPTRPKEGSASNKGPSSIELPQGFPSWVFDEQDSDPSQEVQSHEPDIGINKSEDIPSHCSVEEIKEIRHVRKGICEELAEGPPPRIGTTTATGEVAKESHRNDLENEAIERESTALYEKELQQKFTAILDYLCYEPRDADAWYRAGLCLSFRADIICDRLVRRRNERETVVCTPSSGPKSEQTFSLPDLLRHQEETDDKIISQWVPFIGEDLSPYIEHPWATLASLRSCSNIIKSMICTGQDTPDDDRPDFLAWSQIENMFKDGDFVGWSSAWGGIFVSAISSIIKKCFFTALYLTGKSSRDDSKREFFEITEDFATFQYGEIMGSTAYGYPIHVMTAVQKRSLARESKSCFEAAAECMIENKLDENLGALYFMMGKCDEKIASTLANESFSVPLTSTTRDEDTVELRREYEKTMRSALSNYAKALEDAEKVGDSNNTDVQQGGSSHGIAEVVYRLHASRFKALFWAVKRPKASRDAAEREALRLATEHWYISPGSEHIDISNSNLRDAVWKVLADIVAAMAQLRIDNSFFHRSVYRHAQALLWAPVFYDPDNGYREGSQGSVPPTKAYLLRGLNSHMSCAKSAEAVISAPFDKKRPQLCAVWVATTATPSAFEILNDAQRKYDALRWKYVDSYIDIMRLCKRREALTTFFGWITACHRDLPNFYADTAIRGGGAPDSHHSKTSLVEGAHSGMLYHVKKRTNGAIADIIIHELTRSSNVSVADRIDLLKDSYACFLRVNTPISDKAWKRENLESGNMLEVEALCQAYLSLEETHMSGEKSKIGLLAMAHTKCQNMFPEIGPKNQRKRLKRQTSKGGEGVNINNSSTTGRETTDTSEHGGDQKGIKLSPKGKRGESKEETPRKGKRGTTPAKPHLPGKEKKFVTVSVPGGKKEGDSFSVTIDVGGGKKRKFSLRVPSGGATKLKFAVPSSLSKSHK